MTPEEFKRVYTDTHTELQALDAARENGSLIKSEPGDKNITVRGKIPGKNLIEAKAMEKRAEGLSHCLLDACGARVGELMDIPVDKLYTLAIKSMPQKVDSNISGNMTLVHMIAQAKIDKVETVDVEAADE